MIVIKTSQDMKIQWNVENGGIQFVSNVLLKLRLAVD